MLYYHGPLKDAMHAKLSGMISPKQNAAAALENGTRSKLKKGGSTQNSKYSTRGDCLL